MEITHVTSSLPIGLRYVNDMLTDFGWKRRESSQTEYTFSKDTAKDDEVRIRINEKNITVAVPIRGANFLYASKFDSYYKASEFIEMHIKDYEGMERIRNGSNSKRSRNESNGSQDNGDGTGTGVRAPDALLRADSNTDNNLNNSSNNSDDSS